MKKLFYQINALLQGYILTKEVPDLFTIENEISKGLAKIRYRCHGSAELFGFEHWRFGSAESWFGRKY